MASRLPEISGTFVVHARPFSKVESLKQGNFQGGMWFGSDTKVAKCCNFIDTTPWAMMRT